jgi:nickel-dependent lactate racemase
LRFILNVVLDGSKRILQVRAGDPLLAFQDLVAFARSIFEVAIPNQVDIAFGGVGYPKDSNLYQASRAPSYLYFAPVPVVRQGGFLIIPARCEEGAGEGVGEQRFLSAMSDAPDIQSILDDARRNGYPPGQQRAFVMAKVLENARVIIVGSEHPDLVTQCKMIPAPTMKQALDIAVSEMGKTCDVLIVPHAMLTLPVIQPGLSG